MKDEIHDPPQWPPPPSPGSGRREEKSEYGHEAKLLTGAAWADALLGSIMSLLSFTLLTFILANPLAWHILPKLWSSQFRLLSGWLLANVVQLVVGTFFWRQNYNTLSRSILWASISVASFWLFIILAAWWMFG